MRESSEHWYWQLREDYFDNERMVRLERMPDGLLYSNIFIKMCLKSLKHGGELRLEDGTPCTPQTLAAMTRQPVQSVERALRIFHRLGLAEYRPDGVWRMTDVENMAGCFSDKQPDGDHQASPEKLPPVQFNALKHSKRYQSAE